MGRDDRDYETWVEEQEGRGADAIARENAAWLANPDRPRLIAEHRLTPHDEHRVTSRLASVVSGWRYGSPSWEPQVNDRMTLERIGWAAVGCGEADLRDSELEWIRERVEFVLGLDACGLTVEADRRFEPTP